MKHIGLFAGIGGFELAAKWMNWQTVAWCEWNEFGQKVLRHHFPEAEGFGDITKTDFTKYANTIDILTGGFPCQPYSAAGKRLGKEDERHLWPEMLRAIREISPSYVVGENVRGLTNWNGGVVFDEVQADLEAEGYEVLPFLLPAAGVNAPHERYRIWFIAYANSNANRNFGKQDREANGIPGEHRTEICTRESIGTITGIITNPGLFGQEIGQQQPVGIEQLREERDVADTGSEQFQKRSQEDQRENRKETGTGVDDRPQRFSNTRDAPDTIPRMDEAFARGNEQRLLGANEQRPTEEYPHDHATSYPESIGMERNRAAGQQEPGAHARQGLSACNTTGNDWHIFPTQSPLCSRNDGLPAQLDGITVSKWRNESIKAFGNAIVPQVALQIFKAIQQYHDHNTST